MRFYDCAGFPNPDRVRIALAEKGLLDSVEIIQVDVAGGEHRSAEFLKRNPSGTVPVLELDDGTALSECTAITEYLDTRNPPLLLTGETPRRRGLIHMAQRQLERGLLDAIGAYFHHATAGLGSALETYQIPEWGEHNLQIAARTVQKLDETLAWQGYVVDDEFSMADITAFAGFSFAEIAGVDLMSGNTNIKRWHGQLLSRPSFLKKTDDADQR